MRSIYWFKRDLRIKDNKALYQALLSSKELIPIFIFDNQILKDFNGYNQKLGFILEALKELSKKIKVYCFYGKTEDVFKRIIYEFKPDTIFTSKAFSWQGEKRDKFIKNLAIKNNIKFYDIFDNYLADFTNIPYTKVFTLFYKKWINYIEKKEYKINLSDVKILNLDLEDINKLISNNKNLNFENKIWKVKQGIQRLRDFNFKNYSKTRNFLGIDGTSKLSPYIRFGILSIRQIYNQAKDLNEDFVKELAWREFWYHIKYNFNEFNNLEFQEKRRNIIWQNNEIFIQKFENAETGYPLIDAGIIQLKTENWVHNRMRMILANFLIKDLLVDWRIGEKFFKKYLIDYDEVVNVGNWQWNASVGPDPKPLRIFNPIIQAKKFDSDCSYIKKYIPELKKYNCNELHDPIKYKINYYKPLINHKDQIKIIKKYYFVNNLKLF